MALRTFNPTSPGRRHLIMVDRSSLWSGRPEKTLTFGLKSKAGRNNTGRITMRRRGGGAKRLYREIDFKRTKFDMPARVERLEYDPNRTAFIAFIVYKDGTKSYIIAPQRLAQGDEVISGEKCDIKPGNAMLLANIPVGTLVHNIEMKPGKGGQIARSAGAYVQILGRDRGMIQLRLQSGEVRIVPDKCMATIGAVSNQDHSNINIGKAGRNRHLGKRPSVRGVVMNPVDHPHGGGEGKSSGGRHPVTPWGVSTKGKRTRKNKTTDKYIIRSRHAAKSR